MIIDCHGHYTVLPKAHDAWREEQKAAFKAGTPCPPYPEISDAEIRETIEANQLRLIKERGADLTIFSPRASAMAPHVGDEGVAIEWARRCNDLIARVVGLFPETFVGVCMLPQSPKADMRASIAELERCVTEFGFIGCNLNPDRGIRTGDVVMAVQRGGALAHRAAHDQPHDHLDPLGPGFAQIFDVRDAPQVIALADQPVEEHIVPLAINQARAWPL